MTSRALRHLVLILAGTTVPLTCSAAAPAQPLGEGARSAAAALRAEGLELAYNLDYDQALEAFRAAIAVAPQDPVAYRLVAATMWIQSLFLQGAVLVDDYLGQARSDLVRTPPSPDFDAAFRQHIERARDLAEARLAARPNDADARFQVGSAYGFMTSYRATVEGRLFGSLRTARRAYQEHQRALEIDPGRSDAGLIVGMYRYAISSLSAPVRLLAGLAGFGGGRERGIRLIEQAAAHRTDVQTNALFTLIVVYNREARYDDALGIIERLQARYPRNRLLWLEEASTALRADRPARALTAVERGLAKLTADPRPRAFGEEARWRYHHGAALAALGEPGRARRPLEEVLASDAPGWLRGRAHKELGRIAALSGDRARALAELEHALRVCRAHDDAPCAREAEVLLTQQRGHRR